MTKRLPATIEHSYGNICHTENGIQVYEDGTPAEGNPRPCPKCGKMPTKEGHDGCLGELPGVGEACCGHGIREGCIAFMNGVTIYFEPRCIMIDHGDPEDPDHDNDDDEYIYFREE